MGAQAQHFRGLQAGGSASTAEGRELKSEAKQANGAVSIGTYVMTGEVILQEHMGRCIEEQGDEALRHSQQPTERKQMGDEEGGQDTQSEEVETKTEETVTEETTTSDQSPQTD